MPLWNFFAFNAQSVADAMLRPVQDAVRQHNIAAWQTAFGQLNGTHACPYVSRYGGRYSPNARTTIVEGGLSVEEIPDESSFPLRRTLQNFVEATAQHRLEGAFPKPRAWILREVDWTKLLSSQAERDELELFKSVIRGSNRLPDPFWCLESNGAVDSNYLAPDVVARFAEMEATVGLFRGLARRTDLGAEVTALARDTATASLLIELAAARGMAVYYREDGT